MTRRTLDETKALILQSGLELLHANGVALGVSHIRLQDVVASAGLTTGAAYRLWPSQTDFHRDLAALAITWSEHPPTSGAVTRIADLVKQRAPYPEVRRVGAEAYLHDERPNPEFLISLALRAASSDESAQTASQQRHDVTIDAHVALYEALLHWYQRTMRPPYTVRDIALALAAMSEGLAIQSIVGESHPRFQTIAPGDDTERDWSLLGFVAATLIDTMTAPIESADANRSTI